MCVTCPWNILIRGKNLHDGDFSFFVCGESLMRNSESVFLWLFHLWRHRCCKFHRSHVTGKVTNIFRVDFLKDAAWARSHFHTRCWQKTFCIFQMVKWSDVDLKAIQIFFHVNNINHPLKSDSMMFSNQFSSLFIYFYTQQLIISLLRWSHLWSLISDRNNNSIVSEIHAPIKLDATHSFVNFNFI